MDLTPVSHEHDIICLTLDATKLDMSNAAEFKRKAAQATTNQNQVVLSLEKVEFVDSSGLGALLSCLRDLRSRGGDLCLCSIQPRVMAMLELVRMQKVVPLAANCEDAITTLSPRAAN